jgi:uncharacterized protein YndB with AHSA1/START domain
VERESTALILNFRRRKNSMAKRSITHSSFVIERSFPVKPERVFAAFSDPAEKGLWFAEEEGFGVGEEIEMDFRVGGEEQTPFHGKDSSTATNGTNHPCAQRRRAMFAYTMSCGGTHVSASLATVELVPTEKGTDLIFTELAAFFDLPTGSKIRELGWRRLLEKLGKELAPDEPFYRGDENPCLD